MKTKNIKRIATTVALTLTLGLSVNSWAAGYNIADGLGRIGMGDGVSRAAGNFAGRAAGEAAQLARRTALSEEIALHYTRLARNTRTGDISIVHRRMDQDIETLEGYVREAEASLGREHADVVKLRGALAELKLTRERASEWVFLRAEWSVGDSAQRATQRLEAMNRLTEGGRPTEIQGYFSRFGRTDESNSSAVFVAVSRSASGDISHAVAASDEGVALIGRVFPELSADQAARATFADLEKLFTDVTKSIRASSETPQMRTALLAVAENLNPRGLFSLGRAMGLSTADIVGLTRMGVPLMSADGRIPDVSGKLSVSPMALAKFKANIEAMVTGMRSTESQFRSDTQARRFLMRTFSRVLSSSQDFGSSSLSLAEKIAAAKGVDVDSVEVRSFLASIAELLHITRKNDFRLADMLESAVKGSDTDEIRRLLDQFDSLRRRSRACAS